MLVDAGVVAQKSDVLSAIEKTIELPSVEYIYLTHTDRDHVGCLTELLDEAPRAKLVTTFLGMGKLGLTEAISPERVLLVNPGESIDLGDRQVEGANRPSTTHPKPLGSTNRTPTSCLALIASAQCSRRPTTRPQRSLSPSSREVR
jgi:flavorubredoxin